MSYCAGRNAASNSSCVWIAICPVVRLRRSTDPSGATRWSPLTLMTNAPSSRTRTIDMVVDSARISDLGVYIPHATAAKRSATIG